LEIKIDKQENNYGIITVSVAAADYQEDLDKQLKEYRKRANLKGFRPGQVPMSVVKRMFGKELKGEMVMKKIQDSLQGYTSYQEPVLFLPMAKETLTMADLESDDNISMSFEVVTLPDFTAEDLAKISPVDAVRVQADEADVEKVLARIMERSKRQEDVESVALGDFVGGNFKNAEGTFEDYSVLPTKQLAESVHGLFLGAKVGDTISFNINEALPEANQIKNLFTPSDEQLPLIAGEFHLEITEIKRDQERQMDQEFFDEVLGEGLATDEESFRAELARQISEVNQGYADSFLAGDCQKVLLDELKFELPENLLRTFYERAKEDKEVEEATDGDAAWEGFKTAAKRQAIRMRIIRLSGVEITYEMVVAQAKQQIRQSFMQYGLGNLDEETMERIVSNVLEDKEMGQRHLREAESSIESSIFADFCKKNIPTNAISMTLAAFEQFADERSKKMAAETEEAVAE
jgi:trigger factor